MILDKKYYIAKMIRINRELDRKNWFWFNLSIDLIRVII